MTDICHDSIACLKKWIYGFVLWWFSFINHHGEALSPLLTEHGSDVFLYSIDTRR